LKKKSIILAGGNFGQILPTKIEFFGSEFAASRARQPRHAELQKTWEIAEKLTDDLLGIHIIEFDMLPSALRVKNPALRDLEEVDEHILPTRILLLGQVIKFVNHRVASAGKFDNLGIADAAVHVASCLIDLDHIVDFLDSIGRALFIFVGKSLFLSMVVISFELHIIADIPDVVTLVKFDVEKHGLFWMLVQNFAVFQVYSHKLQQSAGKHHSRA
jgi:hypothetical protein